MNLTKIVRNVQRIHSKINKKIVLIVNFWFENRLCCCIVSNSDKLKLFFWRARVGHPLCRSIKIPAIVLLQRLLYKQEVRPLIRVKASCWNDNTHSYTCTYSPGYMYAHTHKHTSLPLPPSSTHTYMHTYQMGDGCDGAVSLKKRQIFPYQNRNTKKKNREEGGKESDWDGFHGVRLPVLLWTNQSERNQPF